MTTKLLIDRELLEQVASELVHDNDRYMLGRELRKILDAPRQPEGGGLEVVDTVPKWLHDALIQQAKRAIAELRGMLSGEVEINIQLRQQAFDLTEQRDKLAGLLRDTATWIERLPVPTPGAIGQLERIDAALAEVKPCQESPAPTT